MINFDALPKDKPNGSSIEPGRYEATVFKTEMVESKTTHNEYLNVSFKLKDGGFVNENYFDGDKPFLQYKISRLLNACKVTLKGEGTLNDIAKVIKGKSVIIDVDVNDRGYGTLDYSGGNEGIYPVEATTKTVATETELDPEVTEAIEAEVVDEDF